MGEPHHAAALATGAPPEADRAAAREYLLDVRRERGYPIPDDTANS